jgi:hypothetical protein
MKASLVPFAAGCLGGCLFVAALLLLDIGGLGTMMARDQAVFVPLFMLLVNLGGLFGIAVMISSLAGSDHPNGRPVQLRPLPATRPLRSPHR